MALASSGKNVGHRDGPLMFSRATGAVAINETFVATAPMRLMQVIVTLSAVGAGDLTVKLISNASASTEYDATLLVQDMSAITSALVWTPSDGPIILDVGDSVDIDWANSGTVTYGLQLTTQQF